MDECQGQPPQHKQQQRRRDYEADCAHHDIYSTRVLGAEPTCLWCIPARASNVPLVELKVTSRPQGEYVVMSVQGEIDLYTVPKLQRELAGALAAADPVRLVVDLSGVDFCDSTGVNVLLAAHRQAREKGGDLELAAPRPAVRKILQVTGLETVFTVIDNPAHAI